MVLNSYAQLVIDSTNIESLLLAKKEVYYFNMFTLKDSVFEKESILSYPVLFYYDYSGINKISYPFLDSIANFSEKNKSLFIEISNHTDYRGKLTYNLAISKRRAKVIEHYLIAKGVLDSRLNSKGDGETQLIITEEVKRIETKLLQEKSHVINRQQSFE